MGEFRHHIEEAIVVNLKRLPVYALKTFGYSLPISIGLIFFELCIWPLAIYFDLTSKRWYRSDRKVMVDDFISMEKIGFPDDIFSCTQRPKHLETQLGLYTMRFRLMKLLILGKFKKADTMMTDYRHDLNKRAPYQYFLYKHFLESIHRSLRLTLLWDEKEELGPSLKKYRKSFIIIQTIGLEYCIILDLLAYPLYKRGIGIIKNDIPHIPIPKHLESI